MFHRRRSTNFIASLALCLAFLPLAGLAPGQANAAQAVDLRFQVYYYGHEGLRVLGYPITGLTEISGYPAQYFEKGRLEDHQAEIRDPAWGFMYGRLTVELMDSDPGRSVSGTTTSYGQLKQANNPTNRVAPPPGFTGGTAVMPQSGGGVFVPFDSQLSPRSGYVVPKVFWDYMKQPSLFPGGWLHDLGLPLTGPVTAQVVKQGEVRSVTMQAFERAVLTYDQKNPAGWQVEKGNIGSDARPQAPTQQPKPTGIEIPATGAHVMVPLHILARVGQPGEQVAATLRWQDGTKLSGKFTVLRGEDGNGLLIGNLDWLNLPSPPEPNTQAATLQIAGSTGAILSSRDVIVVSPSDPGTREIKLYWGVSGNDQIVQPQTRRVIATERIASTALEELLWGPPAISQVGFLTAIPTPEQVLSFRGRMADWGPRARLLGLTIVNGIATPNFSKEMDAYGGGSSRVGMIYKQISMTLKQFPTVQEVRIAIEGQTEGVLQP